MVTIRLAALSAFGIVISTGAAVAGPTAFATTSAGDLVSFDVDAPGTLTSQVAITGLGVGETVLGIDFRPAAPTTLFALGSGSALYTINTATGVATKVGTGFTTALTGQSYGFDFNPVIDRIRIVGDNNQNIVANPDTGDANVATTVDVFYGDGDANAGSDPLVFASAYTNSVAGATATQLYGIDANLDVLATQANNTGVLGTVGPLGVSVEGVGGFDLVGEGDGIASYAALNTSTTGGSGLYFIALSTGNATLLGDIAGDTITSLAIGPGGPPTVIPVPAALLAAPLAGLVAFIGHRRMRRTQEA